MIAKFIINIQFTYMYITIKHEVLPFQQVLARPISKAENFSSVPRGIKQIQDMKFLSTKKQKTDTHQSLLMIMSNELHSSGSERFIRRITTDADNYSICLYTNDMLDFMLKRCAHGKQPSPIHVDATYQLTNMYALVCTMRAIDFEGHPLVPGPILLTRRQRAKDFIVLWHEICSDRRELKNAPLTFVTDGDDALIQSITEAFPSSLLFRCSLHLADNVKRRQRELGLSMDVVDSAGDLKMQLAFKAEEFDSKSDIMYKRWASKAKIAKCEPALKLFMIYYKRQVHRVVKENVHERVVAAGLEPGLTNNPAESTNSQLKRWNAYKKTKIEELCTTLKDGVLGVYEELQRGYMGLSQKFMSTSLSEVEVSSRRTQLHDIMSQAEVQECEDSNGVDNEQAEELNLQYSTW